MDRRPLTVALMPLLPLALALAAVLKELARHRIHSFPAVNTLFNGLANHPDFNLVDWSHLKISVGGGTALASFRQQTGQLAMHVGKLAQRTQVVQPGLKTLLCDQRLGPVVDHHGQARMAPRKCEQPGQLMGKHQLGEELTRDVIADVAAFLRALDAGPDPRLVP